MTLIKNTSWNVFGIIIPTIIAIPALGFIARTLGLEKFGLFSLVFTIVGYATIFDVGISRAVTHTISSHIKNEKYIKSIFISASVFILIVGFLFSFLFYEVSGLLVNLLNVSGSNRNDAINSIEILSLCTVPLLLTQLWIGYLEGFQRFDIINKQRVLTSSIIILFPSLFIMQKADLAYAVSGVIVARYITLGVTYISIKKYTPKVSGDFDFDIIKQLLGFGGWMTISNIISPLMVYIDRFILSHFLGAANLAVYTAPSDLISRLAILPNAVAKALFPLLSSLNSEETKRKQSNNALTIIGVSLLIVILPMFCFADVILVMWLGVEYAGTPVFVLRILLVGLFFNGLAQVPFAKIQANGNPKLTAILHAFEITPYLVMLFVMINLMGVMGVAIAWTLRVIADCLVLFYVANKKHNDNRSIHDVSIV